MDANLSIVLGIISLIVISVSLSICSPFIFPKLMISAVIDYKSLSNYQKLHLKAYEVELIEALLAKQLEEVGEIQIIHDEHTPEDDTHLVILLYCSTYIMIIGLEVVIFLSWLSYF